MDFDEEAVRTEGNCTTAEGLNEIRAAAALAWVRNDREVGFLFGDSDGGEIERVTGIGLERADAPLAEEDIGVSVGKDVFGGEQPFFDPLAHSALEHDRFARTGTLDEELVVLRVAGADLKNVRRGGNVLDIALAQDFRDNFEPGFAPCNFEQTKAIFA